MNAHGCRMGCPVYCLYCPHPKCQCGGYCCGFVNRVKIKKVTIVTDISQMRPEEIILDCRLKRRGLLRFVGPSL